MALLRVCWLGLLTLCLASCEPTPTVETTPLITIDDQAISRQEFQSAFAATLQADQQLSALEKQELQHAFLVQLVDRALIHAEARRQGIAVTPADLEAALTSYRQDYPAGEFEAMLDERGLTLQAWKEELAESLTIEKLLDQSVYPNIEITDLEIAAYYENNQEAFSRPEQVRVRQILVAEEAEGRRLLGLLRQGEDFASLAQAHSLSPDAENGGDLGFFGRGEMPSAFDAVVFELPVGRISDLVESEYGYHIFLVEEKRPATNLTKTEAAEQIRSLLAEQQREALYLEWLQALRSNARITVDWSQLDTPNQP